MTEKSKYSLLSYVFVLLSVVTIFIFTKNLYFELVENKEQSKVLAQTIEEKKQEYDTLSKIKADVNDPKNKDLQLNKFLVKFSEDELLEYFYTYANTNFAKVKIDALNLTPGTENEFGLNEAQIDLEATFSQEQDMMNMINFLLKSEKYNFYIHDFNYQYGSTSTSPFKVSIPLKVLYK